MLPQPPWQKKNCSEHEDYYLKLCPAQCLDHKCLILIVFPYCRMIPPKLPNVNYFGKVVGNAFAIAMVGYVICISLGKIFALKHGYSVDSNQVKRLLSLGVTLSFLSSTFIFPSSFLCLSAFIFFAITSWESEHLPPPVSSPVCRKRRGRV